MPLYAPLDPAIVARLRARYINEPDTKVSTIAFEEGISPATLNSYVADLPRRRPDQERKRRSAIELAACGLDVQEIASWLKMPVHSVRGALASPPAPPPTPEEIAEAQERRRLAVNARARASRERKKARASEASS